MTAAPTGEPRLARWLVRQAAREARVVVLEEALLGARVGRYAWYRLRWFLAGYLVESVAHAVTAVVLIGTVGGGFALVVGAHAVALLAGHAWWGAAEAMRAEIRDRHRAGRAHRVPEVIADWLLLSLVPAAGVALLGAGWVGWSLWVGGWGVAEALVAATALRLALEFPLRTLHSGVYATRRVYQPMTAVLAPHLAGVVLVVAGTPVVGGWALVAAALVDTGLGTGLRLLYTGRVYRFVGMDLRRAVAATSPAAAWRRVRPDVRPALAAGLAHAATGLDALVVLALLGRDGAAAAVYLVLPTVTAAGAWARLLYFDLKRLELRLFATLARRFERATDWLALLIGAGFALVAAAITLGTGGSAAVAAAVAALVVARSALACAQVQAFAGRAYPAVAGTGLLGAALTVAAAGLATSEPVRIGAVAAAAVATTVLLGALNTVRHRRPPPAGLFTLEWLRRLGGLRGPVLVGSARIALTPGPTRLDARSREEAARWRLARLADRVAERLGGSGAAAWVPPDRVVWFRPAAAAGRPIDAAWLQRISGGLIDRVHVAVHPDGEQALLRTARGGLLGRAGQDLSRALAPVDVAAARREFDRLLPGGIVYAPAERAPAALAALDRAELRAVLADATEFARDLRVRRRRSRFDVTPLCAGGELLLIFIADRAGAARARRRWRGLVRELNLRAAVAGTTDAPALTPAETSAEAAAAPALETLRQLPLLAGLRQAELAALAAVVGRRTVAAGAAVVVEGDADAGFFVIERGRAEVRRGDRCLARLGVGDHFGEIALVAGGRRTATVSALTELHCLTVTTWDFHRLLASRPAVGQRLLTALAGRLLAQAETDLTPPEQEETCVTADRC